MNLATGLLRAAWRGTFREAGPRQLIAMSLIDSVGTGLYIAGSVIFFTQKARLTSGQVGLGLSIAGVVGLAAVLPSGWVAQRFGTWRTLLAFDLWRMAGFTSYVFVHSFAWFLVVVCLLSIPEQSVSPLMQHLAEQVAGPERRTVMMGKIRTVYNVGFTLGAPLSGLAVKFNSPVGYDSLMLGDAATYVLAALMLYRLRGLADLGADKAGDRHPQARRISIDALRDRRYMGAAAVNGVLSLHMCILSMAIPLWITLHTQVPRYAVGPLLVINTALVIPLQVPASALASSISRSVRLMRAAALALATCCLLLAAAARLPLVPALTALAAAVAFLTLGEVAQSAGGWTMAYEMAPTAARAQCLTTFGLSTSAQFVVGPVLLADLVIAHGPSGWIGLGVMFVVLALSLRVNQARPASNVGRASE